MGYRTVRRVPPTRRYETAKATYDRTTPIRGTDNIRPLGERRYWDTYWVRMNGDDVQFMLYKTPVVTYHPGNTITLRTDGWNSISTRLFISQVLGLHCYSHRNTMVVEAGGEKFLLNRDTPTLKLKYEDGYLKPAQARPTMYGLRVNRKAANSVRARMKPFVEYLNGFISLRKTETKGLWGRTVQVVEADTQELADALGVVKNAHGVDLIDMEKFINLHQRPYEVWQTRNHIQAANRILNAYYAGGKQLFDWIESGDTEQYYKAAVALLTVDTSALHASVYSGTAVSKPANVILKEFDAVLMRWYAREILECEALPPGKLPNQKYMSWFGDLDRFNQGE